VQSTNSSGASALAAWVSATPALPAAPTFLSGGISVNPGTGAAALTFGTQNGYAYRIVYNDDLLTNVWTAVTPPLPEGWTNGTGAAITLTDTNSVGVTQRFYRLEAR